MTIKETKQIGKNVLKAYYWKTVAVCLVYGLCVNFSCGLLWLPLNLGMNHYMKKALTHNNPEFKDLFFAFNHTNLGYQILFGLCIYMILAAFSAAITIITSITGGSLSFIPSLATSIFLYFVSFVGFAVGNRMDENPFKVIFGKNDIFNTASNKGGTFMRFVGFDLSFIGWHILDLFTFGLLRIFFLTPYHLMSRAANMDVNYASIDF